MIINSLLDNDKYKFKMWKIAFDKFPNERVKYRFINRNLDMKFNEEFMDCLSKELVGLNTLTLKHQNVKYIDSLFLHGLDDRHINWFNNMSLDTANDIKICLDDYGQLVLEIEGKWADVIWYEVPLMAIISELYFNIIDTDWAFNGYYDKSLKKTEVLKECVYTEFGTRRRRSFASQLIAISSMKNKPGFFGTSNVYMAGLFDVPCIGTVAHELVQLMSVMYGIDNANIKASTLYFECNGEWPIMLTDTFGTKFWTDNIIQYYKQIEYEPEKLLEEIWEGQPERSMGYNDILPNGVRHDSGDPFKYMKILLDFWKFHNTPQIFRRILFSDSLNPELAESIRQYAEKLQIIPSFGIGTNFTNDFSDSPPLNMVIKLVEVNNTPVVKLSDTEGKHTGEKNHINTIIKEINYKGIS